MWDATSSAERGAAYFDELDKAWFETIDDATLDVGTHCGCPIGQRYGDFYAGLDRLGMRWVDAIALGFQIPKALFVTDESRDAAFAKLTAAWREQIARRRLAQATEQTTREVVTV